MKPAHQLRAIGQSGLNEIFVKLLWVTLVKRADPSSAEDQNVTLVDGDALGPRSSHQVFMVERFASIQHFLATVASHVDQDASANNAFFTQGSNACLG
ncbi:hypothetical protein D3C85_1328260 [compost metagenome]